MKSRSAVKTKAKTRATNNQASFGGSLLKNNMEVEAAMEMQLHLDETGVHIVCTIYVCEIFGLLQVCSLKSIYTEQTDGLVILHKVYTVCTNFTQCLHRVYIRTPGLSGDNQGF
jgi:hypothetical protein